MGILGSQEPSPWTGFLLLNSVAFCLKGQHSAESAAVLAFCEDVGLPTTLADIGLGNAGRERLMDAAEKACVPGESIHHEAGLITPEKVLNAMIAADAIGRGRRDRRR